VQTNEPREQVKPTRAGMLSGTELATTSPLQPAPVLVPMNHREYNGQANSLNGSLSSLSDKITFHSKDESTDGSSIGEGSIHEDSYNAGRNSLGEKSTSIASDSEGNMVDWDSSMAQLLYLYFIRTTFFLTYLNCVFSITDMIAVLMV
jgi:hypothetical protein